MFLLLIFNFRELILDGNPLEAEGVIALLSQLSEAAESEGFERAEEIKRKQMAQEEAKRAGECKLTCFKSFTPTSDHTLHAVILADIFLEAN